MSSPGADWTRRPQAFSGISQAQGCQWRRCGSGTLTARARRRAPGRNLRLTGPWAEGLDLLVGGPPSARPGSPEDASRRRRCLFAGIWPSQRWLQRCSHRCEGMSPSRLPCQPRPHPGCRASLARTGHRCARSSAARPERQSCMRSGGLLFILMKRARAVHAALARGARPPWGATRAKSVGTRHSSRRTRRACEWCHCCCAPAAAEACYGNGTEGVRAGLPAGRVQGIQRATSSCVGPRENRIQRATSLPEGDPARGPARRAARCPPGRLRAHGPGRLRRGPR